MTVLSQFLVVKIVHGKLLNASVWIESTYCNLEITSKDKNRSRNLNNLISLGVDHIDWSGKSRNREEANFRKFKKIWSNCNTMHLAMFNIPVLIIIF